MTPNQSILLELVEHGNLFDFIQKKENKLSFKMILTISKNIASALYFLHSQSPKIIHR
jgi:serine/threonine protein kinase